MPASAIPRSRPSSSVQALHKSFDDIYPHRWQVSMKEMSIHNILITCKWLTLALLSLLDLVLDLESLTRVYDINNGRWTSSFEVFQKYSRMATVSVRRIDAFRRKIVQTLEVGVPVRSVMRTPGAAVRSYMWTYITISFS